MNLGINIYEIILRGLGCLNIFLLSLSLLDMIINRFKIKLAILSIVIAYGIYLMFLPCDNLYQFIYMIIVSLTVARGLNISSKIILEK